MWGLRCVVLNYCGVGFCGVGLSLCLLFVGLSCSWVLLLLGELLLCRILLGLIMVGLNYCGAYFMWGWFLSCLIHVGLNVVGLNYCGVWFSGVGSVWV